MLEDEAERPAERNRIGQVPPERGHPRPQARAFGDRSARVGSAVHAQAPGVVEVILGAGALDRRLLLAVDEEEVVALPEPAGLRLDDRQHRSDVMPAPAD